MGYIFSKILFISLIIINMNVLNISGRVYMEGQLKSPAEETIISQLISHYLEKMVYPRTLRIFLPPCKQKLKMCMFNHSLENEVSDMVNERLEWDIQNTPRIVGNNKPLIKSQDPRTISTGRSRGWTERYRYVVVIFILEETPFTMESVLENVKKTVNRRWDRILFITRTSLFLEKLVTNEIVQEYKEKLLVSLEQINQIWTDPLVYNNNKMTYVNSVAELPKWKKMGGRLHGRHIRIASFELRPWVYVVGKEKDGTNKYEGSHITMVETAAKMFNHTIKIDMTSSYGEYWPANDTWTGAYAGVYYPEQNYHMTLYLSHELDWDYGCDFATTINLAELVFLTNFPQTNLHWYSFLLPFSVTVWIWIVSSFVFVGAVQMAVMYLYHGRQMKPIVWDAAVYLPYSFAMEQGLCEIPKGARYISLVWLISCLVLGTGYKATLRERMSYPQPERVPLNFDELNELVHYKITLTTVGLLERIFFTGSPNPREVKLLNRMTYNPDLHKCIRDAFLVPHSVCIWWNPMIYAEMERLLTVSTKVAPLLVSKETPRPNLQSVGFQRDSVIVESYCGVTEVFYEGGLILHLEKSEGLKFKKEGMKAQKDPQLYKKLMAQLLQDDNERKPLSVGMLWAIFAILIVGLIFSAILFGIERYIWDKKAIDTYLLLKWQQFFNVTDSVQKIVLVKSAPDDTVVQLEAEDTKIPRVQSPSSVIIEAIEMTSESNSNANEYFETNISKNLKDITIEQDNECNRQLESQSPTSIPENKNKIIIILK